MTHLNAFIQRCRYHALLKDFVVMAELQEGYTCKELRKELERLHRTFVRIEEDK